MRAIINYLKMIKIEHSVFALPFALSAMVLAAKGMPSWWTIFWIIFCMVTARSGAMGFNRWADAKIDAKNPRTAHREIPAGRISRKAALTFVIVSFILFVFGTYQLNWLTFVLSPVPVLVFIMYSYAKRYTYLCHFALGFALGLSPVGAWIAVTGSFDPSILYLAFGVMAWAAGFDLFYSMQDTEFDAKEGLYSMPARWGNLFTILAARNLHIIAFLLFFIHGAEFNLGLYYFIAYIIAGMLILYEHYIVSKYQMAKINKAFFDMNAIISLILFIGTITDVAIRGFIS